MNRGRLIGLIVLFPLVGNAEEPSPWFATAQVAGTVFHLNDEGNPYRLSAGVGCSFSDRIDGALDLVFGYYEVNAVKDRNPNVEVRSGRSESLGLDARLRLRALTTGRVDWYVQGGAGIQTMLSSPPFPADGSEANFTLMLGPGCLVRFGSRFRVATTVQWFHISNARLQPNNSGYDGIQLVVSPEWRF